MQNLLLNNPKVLLVNGEGSKKFVWGDQQITGVQGPKGKVKICTGDRMYLLVDQVNCRIIFKASQNIPDEVKTMLYKN